MTQPTRICAITVNHNTSHFVELMVRTLFLTNTLRGLDFHLDVLDNASDDAHSDELKAYLAEQQLPLTQTGFDTSVAVEKHGVALMSYVLAHPDCTHYLFLDSDMWFIEPETIATMLEELTTAPAGMFANQARILGYYAGRVIEGQDGRPGANSLDGVTWETWCGNDAYAARYATRIAPRCSPVCSLVANSPVFQSVVSSVGLAPAIRFGVSEAIHHDTCSLMTQVMATHGYHFIISVKQVNHFTETAYVAERRAPKDRDCLQMLTDLRAGRGMGANYFLESEWAREQSMSK